MKISIEYVENGFILEWKAEDDLGMEFDRKFVCGYDDKEESEVDALARAFLFIVDRFGMSYAPYDPPGTRYLKISVVDKEKEE